MMLIPGSALTEKEMPRRRYLGEVAYMDREIGRLLRGLRDRLGGDRILTAIVSDHGEGLGDHGENPMRRSVGNTPATPRLFGTEEIYR